MQFSKPQSVENKVAELIAPLSWNTVDFISDLHLNAVEPATFNAWQRYMATTSADAVFILGDLFEVWVGDDVILGNSHSHTSFDKSIDAVVVENFENRCAQVLGKAASRIDIFFMHGNRDFLVGPNLMDMCNVTLLEDPCLLVFANHRWLLSHGDTLCLDDIDYLQFRQMVRSPAWQKAFLKQPLAERQLIALGLRQQSEARKQSGALYADVDKSAAQKWMQAARAQTLIHGHTHKPANHDLGQGLKRMVLSDWDANAIKPRVEVLRVDASGIKRISLVS